MQLQDDRTIITVCASVAVALLLLIASTKALRSSIRNTMEKATLTSNGYEMTCVIAQSVNGVNSNVNIHDSWYVVLWCFVGYTCYGLCVAFVGWDSY